MAFWNRKAQAAEQKTYSLDSPALMELMRGDNPSMSTVSPETAMRLSTVYSCIKVLSETVSTLPCHLYKLSQDRVT